MKRFVEGADRGQSTLLPECLDDWIDEENPVRVIDAFVDALDLGGLGFDGVEPAVTWCRAASLAHISPILPPEMICDAAWEPYTKTPYLPTSCSKS